MVFFIHTELRCTVSHTSDFQTQFLYLPPIHAGLHFVRVAESHQNMYGFETLCAACYKYQNGCHQNVRKSQINSVFFFPKQSNCPTRPRDCSLTADLQKPCRSLTGQHNLQRTFSAPNYKSDCHKLRPHLSSTEVTLLQNSYNST